MPYWMSGNDGIGPGLMMPLLAATAITLTLSIVLYFVRARFPSVLPRNAAYNPSAKLFPIIAILSVMTTSFGAYSSYNSPNWKSTQESKQAESAVIQAKEAERLRVASLTPEQRETEAQKKADAAKTAAQATSEAAKKTATENAEKSRQALQVAGLLWNYDESSDAMGKGTIKYATVKSTNQIEFAFPYASPQRATLQIRKHPRYGNNAILSIERGQFICYSDDCYIDARFDDGKAQRYNASEPTDNSHTVIFINNYSKFIGNLRKAHTLRIEAPFYNEGNRVFQYDVEGLEW